MQVAGKNYFIIVSCNFLPLLELARNHLRIRAGKRVVKIALAYYVKLQISLEIVSEHFISRYFILKPVFRNRICITEGNNFCLYRELGAARWKQIYFICNLSSWYMWNVQVSKKCLHKLTKWKIVSASCRNYTNVHTKRTREFKRASSLDFQVLGSWAGVVQFGIFTSHRIHSFASSERARRVERAFFHPLNILK